jgi:hypothetical protein
MHAWYVIDRINVNPPNTSIKPNETAKGICSLFNTTLNPKHTSNGETNFCTQTSIFAQKMNFIKNNQYL